MTWAVFGSKIIIHFSLPFADPWLDLGYTLCCLSDRRVLTLLRPPAGLRRGGWHLEEPMLFETL